MILFIASSFRLSLFESSISLRSSFLLIKYVNIEFNMHVFSCYLRKSAAKNTPSMPIGYSWSSGAPAPFSLSWFLLYELCVIVPEMECNMLGALIHKLRWRPRHSRPDT